MHFRWKPDGSTSQQSKTSLGAVMGTAILLPCKQENIFIMNDSRVRRRKVTAIRKRMGKFSISSVFKCTSKTIVRVGFMTFKSPDINTEQAWEFTIRWVILPLLFCWIHLCTICWSQVFSHVTLPLLWFYSFPWKFRQHVDPGQK